MMTIRKLYNRIKDVDTDKIASESVSETTDGILTYNLDQLLDGKTNTGEDISPSYLDDPYFKTKEAAQRYSDWKDKISPASRRKKGVPNLYINGHYHSSITVTVHGNKVITESSFLPNMEDKFRGIYGLNKDSRNEFIPLILRPVFKSKILAATGLKMKVK